MTIPTLLEAGFFDPSTRESLQVTYPFFFDEPPGWPYPEFTGMNHRQCQIAIFTWWSHAAPGSSPRGAHDLRGVDAKLVELQSPAAHLHSVELRSAGSLPGRGTQRQANV